MSIEAMKQALEALERCVATCFDQYAHHQVMSRPEHFVNQAITTLRQAIEKAQKQEPFGYFQFDLRLDAWVQNRHSNKGVAFYTSPPPRQPLTEEQMFEMAEIAWRHGWASCRDAEYVGEEAEDERWGMVGAEVVQDIAAHGIKGEA